MPVAERAGVYIGIHPDDPPVYPLGGVPRALFGSFAGFCKAMEIADSPNIGVCLCLGCWPAWPRARTPFSADPSVNAPKDAYAHGCFPARLDECRHVMADSPPGLDQGGQHHNPYRSL